MIARAEAQARRPNTAQVALAEQRAVICQACEHNQGVTLTLKGHAIYTTRCKPCGCGGMSLVHGECPDGRWEKEGV